MTKAIWVEGWACRSCKKIFDNIPMAEDCCKEGNINNRRIDWIFNGAPTLQELKDLRYTVGQRIKKLSDY